MKETELDIADLAYEISDLHEEAKQHDEKIENCEKKLINQREFKEEVKNNFKINDNLLNEQDEILKTLKNRMIELETRVESLEMENIDLNNNNKHCIENLKELYEQNTRLGKSLFFLLMNR